MSWIIGTLAAAGISLLIGGSVAESSVRSKKKQIRRIKYRTNTKRSENRRLARGNKILKKEISEMKKLLGKISGPSSPELTLVRENKSKRKGA